MNHTPTPFAVARLACAGLLAALTAVATLPALGQTPSLAGTAWNGQIDVAGQQLGFTVRFMDGSDGLAATMDIPVQNGFDLALTNVRAEGDAVHFELPAGPGLAVFDGRQESENRIAGTFTQAGLSGTFWLAPAAQAPGEPGEARDLSAYSGSVLQYVDVDDRVIALTGVTLVDGTGTPARAGQTIVVEDGRIRAVGPDGSVEVPTGARVMELAGHVVTPGLVGLHNHTFYTTSRRRAQLSFSAPMLYLASGVTTARTTGSYHPYSELNLKHAIDDGQQAGPRLFVTGPYITGGSGMTYMTRLSGPEDARRVVRYWAEEGVSWMKAYTLITRAELAAAIDEAHKHGIKVTGHLCSVSFREAVALGIDNIEHGFWTNTDYASGKEPDACPSDFRSELLDVDLEGEAVQATFRDMIEHDVAMTSTLAVYEMFVPGRPPLEDRVLAAMSPEVAEDFQRSRDEIAARKDDPDYVFTEELLAKAIAYEYAFFKAGGVLASGVDPTGYGGALPGYGDQRNYELLLEGDFTPEEAIQVLSLNGARVLGIDDELGSVEVGKVADLVVIEGDPLSRPDEIRNVRYVFKDGLGYSSAELVRAVAGVVGIR